MSKSYSSLREDLIRTAKDKAYRHAYAEESLNLSIATQMKVLREQRGFTQERLAQEAGMKQSMISRCENVNYSSWSINTLRKLAQAFDVFLDVRFRSFRDLVESTDRFGREALQVPAFTEDPFFREEQSLGRQPQAKLIHILPASPQHVGVVQDEMATYTTVGSAASAAVGPHTRVVITGLKYA